MNKTARNHPPGYRLLSNFSALTAASFFSAFISGLALAYYSRVIHPVGLGELSVCAALVGNVSVFCTWGYFYYGTEQIAHSRERTSDVVSSLQSLKTVLSLSCFVVYALIVWFSHATPHMQVLYWLYGLTILSSCYLADWPFQGLEEMHWTALARIMASIGYLLVVLAGISLLRGHREAVWVIPIAMVFSQLLSARYLWIQFRKLGYRFHFVFRFREWTHLYATYTLNGVSTLLGSLFLTLDIMMLSRWVAKEDVGFYSAGQRLVSYAIQLTYIFNTAVYPILVRYSRDNRQAMSRLVSYVTRLLLTVYVPLCMIGLTLAAPILRLILGPSFQAGGNSLEILLVASCFTVANLFYSQVYLALQQRLLIVGVLAFQVLFNAGLNYYWIPYLGREGAALAKLSAEAAGSLVILFLFRRFHTLQLRTIMKPLPALLLLGLVLYICRSNYLSAWFILPISAFLYIIFLGVTRGATPEDAQYLMQVFRKKDA